MSAHNVNMLKCGFLCLFSDLMEFVTKEKCVIVSIPSQSVAQSADLDEIF